MFYIIQLTSFYTKHSSHNMFSVMTMVTNNMKTFSRLLALFVLALSALPVFAQNKVNIFVATGPTAGVYYPLGGGLADVLTKHVPNLNATAGTTDGSMANLLLMGQGKADVGFTMADAGWDAYKGQGKFDGKPINIRALMVLYPNRMHVVTVDGTKVSRLKDLKGRRIATEVVNITKRYLRQHKVKAEVEFSHHMRIERIYEAPRVTKPYTEDQWRALDGLGRQVDADLADMDVRLTQGGEPTFVSIDDFESPEWNTDAVGPTKRELADAPFIGIALQRLGTAFVEREQLKMPYVSGPCFSPAARRPVATRSKHLDQLLWLKVELLLS